MTKKKEKMSKNSKTCKKQYFSNLNSRIIMGTKKFWATVKSLFFNKSKTANTIILHENHRITKDSKKISHTLNKNFTNLTKTIRLKKTSPALKNKPLKHVVKNFKNQERLHGKEKELNIYSIFSFPRFNEFYLFA